MIKRTIEQVALARVAIPIAIAATVLGMAINEFTYQHTKTTLDRGIALTDARVEALKTQKLFTEMEAAARAVVGNANPADKLRFEAAAQALPKTQDKALALVASVDSEGLVSVDRVRGLVEDQARRLREWVAEAVAANGGAAENGIVSADARARIAELDLALTDVLNKATNIQTQARVNLYDAFLLSRLAIHGLLLLSCFGFLAYTRQVRQAVVERAQENERLERQIDQRTAELRGLASHLVTVREDERARLARDLHDEMGGLLTAMKLELARLRRVKEMPPVALERAAGIEARLNDGIALKRRIIENLRPSSLDQLGLKTALEMLCADSSAVTGLPINTQLDDVSVGDKDAELSLYRMVQESLTNIAKYSAAQEVWVRLQRDTENDELVTLTVQDNGRGFDPAKVANGHHGLFGMRVRLEGHGGILRIDSVPGQGTRIVATLPMSAAQVDELPV